jgi:hypothetical protein
MIRGKDFFHFLWLAIAAGTDVSKQAFLEPLVSMDKRHLTQNFSSVFFLSLHRDFFSTWFVSTYKVQYILFACFSGPYNYTPGRVPSLGKTFRFRPRPGPVERSNKQDLPDGRYCIA